MNASNRYMSAKKDFRRRLLLRFAAILPLILTANVFHVHQYGIVDVPSFLAPLVLLPLWLWGIIGFGPMLATELYSASFRCPECGELYGGGLSLSRIHKRGCCAYCGLRLFKKDTINWRLE
jgi:hypothetical protein